MGELRRLKQLEDDDRWAYENAVTLDCSRPIASEHQGLATPLLLKRCSGPSAKSGRYVPEGEIVDVGNVQPFLRCVDDRPIRRDAFADLRGGANVGHHAGEGIYFGGMVTVLRAGAGYSARRTRAAALAMVAGLIIYHLARSNRARRRMIAMGCVALAGCCRTPD